jgi:hypothetical protein
VDGKELGRRTVGHLSRKNGVFIVRVTGQFWNQRLRRPDQQGDPRSQKNEGTP